MSSAAAQRVPVRAKRIGAGPRLDQLEVPKLAADVLGRYSGRKERSAAGTRLAAERVAQEGGTWPGHCRHLSRVGCLRRLRKGMEASLVEEKIKARLDR